MIFPGQIMREVRSFLEKNARKKRIANSEGEMGLRGIHSGGGGTKAVLIVKSVMKKKGKRTVSLPRKNRCRALRISPCQIRGKKKST